MNIVGSGFGPARRLFPRCLVPLSAGFGRNSSGRLQEYPAFPSRVELQGDRPVERLFLGPRIALEPTMKVRGTSERAAIGVRTFDETNPNNKGIYAAHYLFKRRVVKRQTAPHYQLSS
jgi:hypothetical protein